MASRVRQDLVNIRQPSDRIHCNAWQAVEKRPVMMTEAVFTRFAHAICC
jgi:hypothetical protein